MINVVAGFWIRLLTLIIDFIASCAICLPLAIPMVSKHGHYDFTQPWMFYVWILIAIFSFIFFFFLLPWLTKGKTLGMLITRTKIIFSDKKIVTSLVRREIFIGGTWIMVLILIAIFINHTLIGKFAQNNQKVFTYSDWEQTRIAIVSTFSSFLLIFQLICLIGIAIKGDKRGFHDRLSNTSTVWSNKFIEKSEKSPLVVIPPRMVNNTPVEWLDGK